METAFCAGASTGLATWGCAWTEAGVEDKTWAGTEVDI